MGYKIPSDEEIADAIKRALARRGVVNSQRKLAELVRTELKTMDPDYTVAEERVRMLAIDRGLAKLSINARDTLTRTSSNKCPVCSKRMKHIKNLTVYGGSVDLGYRCSKCGYWTGLKARRPTRYIFSLKD
ncbi:MAG: hypothetical protein OEV21_03465 [Thermoplasmata archaeon]|nr:hypothetical protein [Thermoplasmata archaeon]